MTKRFSAALSRSHVVAFSLVLVAAMPAPAQNRRTPDGHPDLQGLWAIGTKTPLERPKEFAGKATVTDAEARAFENKPETLGPDEGDSPAETALNQAEKAVGSLESQFPDERQEMARVRGAKRTSLIVDPRDGKMPARTETGKKRMGTYFENTNVGETVKERPAAERCLPDAPLPVIPLPKFDDFYRIIQTPDAVLIQDDFDIRIVRMNSPHLPAGVRLWDGDSVGHWEGSTLVIDTANFNDELNGGGTDRNLHVVERISRAGGHTLLYRATVDDATAFTRPWTIEFPWVASAKPVFENSCHEGNYSLRAILDGIHRDGVHRDGVHRDAGPDVH